MTSIFAGKGVVHPPLMGMEIAAHSCSGFWPENTCLIAAGGPDVTASSSFVSKKTVRRATLPTM